MPSIELPPRLWERLARHAEVRKTTPEDLAVRVIDLFLNDIEAKSEINEAMARPCLSILPAEEHAPAPRLTLRHANVEHVVGGPRFMIGSDPSSHLVLGDAERMHALVEQVGSRWFIADAGSQSGLFWGEQRIQRKAILDGDEFRIGPHRLTFRLR